MKARYLKPGKTILIDGEVTLIREVNNTGQSVYITGLVYTHPGKKYTEHGFALNHDVKLCTLDGILTEGKTKAEIRAESVYFDLVRHGLEAELKIERDEYAVWAYVRLPSEYGAVSDSFSGGWYTRLQGRKTTGFRGFTVRGMYRGRKKTTANVNERRFHQEVSSRISMAQYRMRKAAEEGA